jgi:hypothetical protein
MMDAGGLSWALINIVGPLLLALVILYAVLRNRKSKPEEIERTEQATRELYREEDRAHRDDTTLGT